MGVRAVRPDGTRRHHPTKAVLVHLLPPPHARRPAPGRARPLALLPLLLAACGSQSASAKDGGASAGSSGLRAREIPRVRVAPVRRHEMVRLLETTSVLESEREIEVFPRMGGVVVEVLAEEGDRVAAGDVLARLDDRDEALAVREAEVTLAERENDAEISRLAVEEAGAMLESARLSEAQRERDYERNRKLYEEGETKLLSRQELEASRLELDRALSERKQADVTLRRSKLEEEAAATAVSRAKVALERARLVLDHTRVLAPFEGVVAERKVRLGDSVSQNEPVFVLTDIDALRAVFFRPQEELELFVRHDGDGAGLLTFGATSEAYPGRAFSGEIERISPTIDAESGQFRVTARMHVPEDDGPPLLPGMLVRMKIVTDRHEDALVVPKRALRRDGERRYVLAVEDAGEGGDSEYELREVDVREGFAGDDDLEVLPLAEGTLPEGRLVVVVGGRDLEQGDPVLVDDDGEPDGAAAEDE